jgi:hypothetical protein
MQHFNISITYITVCKCILQAINEIRKKYELEKIEITNAEKEKVHKLLFRNNYLFYV